MSKISYFFVICTFVPLILISCPNEVPGAKISSEYGNLVSKELAPIVKFYTELYQEFCPNQLTDSMKAKIYLFSEKEYSYGVLEKGLTVEESVENISKNYAPARTKFKNGNLTIDCDRFVFGLR